MAGGWLLVKVGWRNLWRNPRRTLLTALALCVGLALLLISLGLIYGSHEQKIANGVQLGAGHVVVQARGYQDTRAQDLLLPPSVVSATEDLLRSRAGAGVLRGIGPRLLASGLLSSATNSSGVDVVGVIPAAEESISLIPQRIVEGSYLQDAKPSGVVMGAELARKLAVRLGSKVVLTTQAVRQPDAQTADGAAGEMQSALLRVTGIFRTGLREFDAYTIHLPLPEVQTLLGAPDQVTQVAVFLAQAGDSSLVAMRLRERLTGVPVEVLTWRESLTEMAQLFWLNEAFNYVTNGVLLVMVGLGVLNTILMAVLERHHEFGVCAAVGLRPGQLAGMILCESLMLAGMSLTLGLLLGLGVHLYFAAFGLDLRWFVELNLPVWKAFDPVFYSRLSPGQVARSVGVVFLMTVILSVYPVLKAARTALPDALKAE